MNTTSSKTSQRPIKLDAIHPPPLRIGEVSVTEQDLERLVASFALDLEDEPDGRLVFRESRREAVSCFACAEEAQQKLGMGKVLGYFGEDNPTARLGSKEGGHDFLLIGGRFIVDIWAKDTVNYTDRYVLDLAAPAQRNEIDELYGPMWHWDVG